MSTANVTANLADHLAIRSLMDRYTDALNRRDWTAMRATFATDGTWQAGGGPGEPPAIRYESGAACADGIGSMVTPLHLCIQSNHAPVIDVQGGSATATSTMNEVIQATPAGPRTTIWGMYRDRIARGADGEWRFAERRFGFLSIETTGAAE